MLSEDENAIKKLNEILKKWQEIVNIEDKTEREIEMSLYMEDMPFEEIKTVLNLITKLQKEIEHQKEKRENQKVELAILNEKQKEMNKLINDVKSYKGQFKKQEKEIKKLQKENEERDKQLDLIIEEFYKKMKISTNCYIQRKRGTEQCLNHKNCKECLKQYFEKLAKKENK